MRSRYTLLTLAVALFFAIGMMAQTSSSTGSSDQNNSDQSSMQSGSSQSGQSTTYGTQEQQTEQNPGTEQGNPTNRQPGMGAAPQTPTGGYGGAPATGAQPGTSSQMGTQSNEEQNETPAQEQQEQRTESGNMSSKGKTIEGCVFRRETDYYIFPTHGQPQRISNNGQSVSEHVGHEVKLHGTEESSGATSSAGNPSSEQEATTGRQGAMAGNEAGATTSAAAGAGNQEFVVDKVQMVSESCPANIQRNAQAQGMSNK
jgi:hypothetical protein